MTPVHHHLREDVFETRSMLVVDPASSDSCPGTPPNLCTTDESQGIDRIREAGKNVLLYFWAPSKELKAKISRTRFGDLPVFSATTSGSALALLPTNAPDELSRQVLLELADALAVFAALRPQNKINVAFCKTQNRSCPLFHVDRVPYRLLCTLRGPGTEWLADDAVSRRGLGKGSNRKVTKPGALVYEVMPFQVCVLKGESGFGNAGAGAVHRSPAVTDTTEGRWYLRVDQA